jgi:hypothetical protein
MEFTMYSDEMLKRYVKIGVFSYLKDKELLELKYELTQVPSREVIPVPLKLIVEIRERGLEEKEERALYGEYGSGK